MVRTALPFLVAFFLFNAFLIVAADAAGHAACLTCHGIKGKPGYVDAATLGQSVHGRLRCIACHLGMSGYPHGEIIKVDCGICHFIGREGAPEKQAQRYQMSVHGKAALAGDSGAPTCRTCHGDHNVFPPIDTRSTVNRQKIPALCAGCHPQEYAAYAKSIHGMVFIAGGASAPTCFDCHLEHLTPPVADRQWMLALIKECGSCHAEEMRTYRSTYHGQVTELGYATVAKCSDCHGSHAIVPVTDPASPLAPGHILTTCRKCHPRATAGFTKFYAHPDAGNRAKYPILYYTTAFMTALLVAVFVFFFVHTFLWAYRSLRERIHGKGGRHD